MADDTFRMWRTFNAACDKKEAVVIFLADVSGSHPQVVVECLERLVLHVQVSHEHIPTIQSNLSFHNTDSSLIRSSSQSRFQPSMPPPTSPIYFCLVLLPVVIHTLSRSLSVLTAIFQVNLGSDTLCLPVAMLYLEIPALCNLQHSIHPSGQGAKVKFFTTVATSAL